MNQNLNLFERSFMLNMVMARLYIHQVTGIPLILMSNKGDPPHAAQKVFQDIVEHGSFATVSADATFIADKFKNTRLKQFQ